MSDVQRQAAPHLRTFGHKKSGTSTFPNPSLVSPHTPTLANPVRGFGLPTAIRSDARSSLPQRFRNSQLRT